MREIVLDTETTGFDPLTGHRIVEIGCVEAINFVPTDRYLHLYINPERDMPPEAFAVHGLSEEFLRDKPVFAEICGQFLDFIGDSRLVIHNAEFDMRFINAELKRLGIPTLPMTRALDTVQMARRKFPGAPASLDALCRRFSIDNSNRTLHGALLDAQLLGEVYLELQGGRQPDLVLAGNRRNAAGDAEGPVKIERIRREPRPHAPTEAELEAHGALLKQLKNPMWLAGAS
ncbi:DNA polymerase III subunit epsilon [Skermanella sp. TT6]|uniref:DNA polymerase III subunit epsilon n=1 Tax=Skermanella cutis TaxID=2775420 RepID=A0ABX7B540_9PROT|nr:DNA polymerase III subunit epsilon [Skermanella sp. TT6]QQP89456.1 DNA polymerase III subunit epsilon [Skermanella sp. TT6]